MSNENIITKESRSTGAILGAAYGDALGWPNERTKKKTVSVSKDLKKWEKKSGGRYFPYTEIIDRGSYSDDTQLILSLYRSYQHNDKWWDYWTKVELPFWTVYERGGGGATKRSAKCWLGGCSPWSKKRKKEELEKYFNAGGNGVAMRTLPHILSNFNSSYETIEQNIFRDGMATHGHSEALTGALVYGHCLWKSFHRKDILTYGQLIEESLEYCNKWNSLTDRFNSVPEFDEWYSSAKSIFKDYEAKWISSFEKIKKYLKLAKEESSNGAIANDNQLLEKINCFDRKINGAGTTAAVASIYLASRYAVSPINGVVKAAFSIGTDTIASMTGGLLGLLCGHHWIIPQRDSLQDGEYLENISLKILLEKKNGEKVKKINSSDMNKWLSSVLNIDNKIDLLDGRKASIKIVNNADITTNKFSVAERKIQCEDGQSLYYSKISKRKNNNTVVNVKIKLFVSSLEKSLEFYTKCFNMEIEKKNGKIIVFKEGIVLAKKNGKDEEKSYPQIALCVQVVDIEKTFNLVKNYNVHIESNKINDNQNQKYFHCSDLDGIQIEVSSVAGMKK